MQGVLSLVHDCLRHDEGCAFATVIATRDQGPSHGPQLGAKVVARDVGPMVGSLGSSRLDAAVEQRLRRALAVSRGGIWRCGVDGNENRDEVTLFIDVYPSPARMFIFGAVDFTRALVKVAKALDYRVTVCDARKTFATSERFPEADHVVVDWPDHFLRTLTPSPGPSDAICVLTHDQKFDVPALIEALKTPAGYIGAMGSRQTNVVRRHRLESVGLSAPQLERLMAPIGIDIGARSPEETAIAICAEIIARRSDTPVPSLRNATGPIHRAKSRERQHALPL